MNIDQFYEEDPRRRASAEIELGHDWADSHGVSYELNYVEDTGELYVMQEPPPREWIDPFGGIHPNLDHDDSGLLVRVVAHIPTVDQLHQVIEGWQEQMLSGGVEWLAERLRAAGVATAAS
ncbi:MAG TPA: hypothetical protein VGG38_07405 [Acidimicrobiales bacterium]